MALGNVTFQVSPGVVSLLYFILLDLTFLTLFDIVFAKLAALFYLRRIRSGKPLKVHSSDVLGLSTYLVGSYRTPINIIIIIIKLLLLSAIVFVDLNIGSDQVKITAPLATSGFFNFDPSADAWDNGSFRAVERRFERVRTCKYRNPESEQIEYYALAFNVTGLPDEQTTLDTEITTNRTLIPIDPGSEQCLGRNLVLDTSELRTARVMGCSRYLTTFCRNGTVVVKDDVDLPFLPGDRYEIFAVDYGVITINYEVRRFSDAAIPYFPSSYQNISFNCFRNIFGIMGIRMDIFETCILTASYNDGADTLIERWDYDRTRRQLYRFFPGPVFQGRFDVGVRQQILAVQHVVEPRNWEVFSSTLVADAAVYEKKSMQVTRITDEVLVTVLPWSALIVTIVVGLLAISFRVAAIFFLGSDELIQLNTIDGLSSIGREENQPSGRSFKSGKHMVIGLTSRDGQRAVAHFGPMRQDDVGVSRSKDIVVR